jgi:hypothetical protein
MLVEGIWTATVAFPRVDEPRGGGQVMATSA